ncbi:hypothetical protein Mvan_2533 [Mycolicibacterium vanbaalenii PYR-1]|uniref:Uncharacterized protein n=1 Tax=Mycolicibacterium vanbaalenii (strain DSM 7251 / JCM 13017 / BCRC 16820 / KCTC 9966 / NRRL B-24157 / PYR-1) TaxID=350058 RepID=A1T844_MYCVP|nr:hypothetical protein Mvan_2533 [Mycolicibacterium vanbaalenii PYR-1]
MKIFSLTPLSTAGTRRDDVDAEGFIAGRTIAYSLQDGDADHQPGTDQPGPEQELGQGDPALHPKTATDQGTTTTDDSHGAGLLSVGIRRPYPANGAGKRGLRLPPRERGACLHDGGSCGLRPRLGDGAGVAQGTLDGLLCPADRTTSAADVWF